MVAALGLYQLTRVRVLVDLNVTRLASSYLGLCSGRSTASRSLWVKDGDDVTQAVAVLTQQVAKLLLELDFALQAIIIF